MPYEWTDHRPHEVSDDTPAMELMAWPHQSLTAPGFTWFIGLTAALLTLPLVVLIGSTIAWVFMIFFVATIASIWHAIMRNRRDRSGHEELLLWPDRMNLVHVPARGDILEWDEQPYWVEVRLRDDGPVEHYLTLRGKGREVELGAFLTPEERVALHEDLQMRLSDLRRAQPDRV